MTLQTMQISRAEIEGALLQTMQTARTTIEDALLKLEKLKELANPAIRYTHKEPSRGTFSLLAGSLGAMNSILIKTSASIQAAQNAALDQINNPALDLLNNDEQAKLPTSRRHPPDKELKHERKLY